MTQSNGPERFWPFFKSCFNVHEIEFNLLDCNPFQRMKCQIYDGRRLGDNHTILQWVCLVLWANDHKFDPDKAGDLSGATERNLNSTFRRMRIKAMMLCDTYDIFFL